MQGIAVWTQGLNSKPLWKVSDSGLIDWGTCKKRQSIVGLEVESLSGDHGRSLENPGT